MAAAKKITSSVIPTASAGDLKIAGRDNDAGVLDSCLVDEDTSRHTIDTQMVESIALLGVITPVVCRQIDGVLWVRDGRRRVLHARALAEKTGEPVQVPYVVEDGGDDTSAKVRAVVANAMRVGHSHVAEARKAKDLLDRGESEDRVAATLGIARTTMLNRLKLLELHPKIQKGVEQGKITAAAAMTFRKMESPEQLRYYSDYLETAPKVGTGKKGSVARASAAAGKAETGYKAPTTAQIKAILLTERGQQMTGETRAVLEWAAGEKSAANIPGLIEAIAQVSAAKAAKKAPKNDPRKPKATVEIVADDAS